MWKGFFFMLALVVGGTIAALVWPNQWGVVGMLVAVLGLVGILSQFFEENSPMHHAVTTFMEKTGFPFTPWRRR